MSSDKAVNDHHKQTEAHLRAILETVVDGIITIDDRGLIQTANPAAERIFGYSQADMLHQNVNMLMPEPYAVEHDGYLHNYLTTGKKKIIGIGREVAGQRKDGSTFPMELAVSEMQVDGRRMFTGIVRDISSRKLVEEDIRDREQRIRALIDTIVDGIIVIDSSGLVDTFNPAAERLFGYSASEVQGKNINMLMPEPYAAEHDGYLHNYLTTGERKIIGIGREVTGKRKDGSTFPMELAVSEMQVGGQRMFTGIVRDISERKEAEAALAEKTRDLKVAASYDRSLSRIMALFHTNFDNAAIFQSVLDELAARHGFQVSAVCLFDESNDVLHCVASRGLPDSKRHELRQGSGLVSQAAHDGQQIVLTAPEDMPFVIDTGLFPITPAAVVATPFIYGEKVLGVMSLASTTHFSENELGFIERLADQIAISLKSLNQYHDLETLSEQLKQRGREISFKNRELEQANRLKSEFLATMSHELRTPLNAIIGFSEVLKDELIGELNPEQSDSINEIFSSANHLLSLINDILDLSKIEAGKMELFLETTNVHELLSNALSVVKENAHNHNINLDLEIDDAIGLMRVDGRKLKQIIFNLLSNAVKFTPDGGRVSIDAQIVEDNLLVKVTDTGIGIAEDKIGLLFRPFEQLDGSLSRQFEGTGLGLAMVKRLVELHGGQVNVSSKVGEGSCFQFGIPVLGPDDEQDFMSTGIANDAGARRLAEVQVEQLESEVPIKPELLLVEDNDQAADLMAVQLRDAGYFIHRARSGSEGLELADSIRPDLVVMDIILPDINGWEVMRRMNEDAALQNIPVVVVSIVADMQKGIELGAMSVLQKPIHRDTLIDAVMQSLPAALQTASARILVVDDDRKAVHFMVNQLEGEGFHAIGAYGGQQAIDIVHDESPDLIILDLMMPVVSGFDVVSMLRANAATRNIPVAILTAKVLTDEDRQQLDEQVFRVISKSEFDMQRFLFDVRQSLSMNMTPVQTPRHTKDGSLPLVMMVEDNASQAEILRYYLEDSGYRVRHAVHGKDALQQMHQELPDLVTLDLLMPEMDGFVFLEAKQAIAEFAAVPVVVLSSIASRVEGSPLAADAVLSKPIRRTDLLATLDNMLSSRKQGSSARAKIAFIDDDPQILKILASYLQDQDEQYEILTAAGGREGIELVSSAMPELVFLDLMMPEVSGFDVLQALKSDERTSRIPVIILTAKILSEDERHFLQGQVSQIRDKAGVNQKMLTDEVGRILKGYTKP